MHVSPHSEPERFDRTPVQRQSTTAIEQIGKTPLLELRSLRPQTGRVRVFGKAEWFNPGGSVKDRAALSIIRQAERRGQLTRNKALLDATSGNTGIGYAMVGAGLGYRVRLVVPGNIGKTHRAMLEAYGAELTFSDPQCGSDGAIEKARRLAAEHPDEFFYADQYVNPANWRAHYHGTAREIISQTNGEITHFVAALGTSGTFMGTARRLKEFNRRVKAVSLQPDSPMHGLEGMKHMPTSIVPAFYDEGLADDNLWVPTESAYQMVRFLARYEGLMVGPSAGAAVAASVQVARSVKSGLVVTILCDAAYKYLDYPFWKENSDGH